jgi:hypothetical protein
MHRRAAEEGIAADAEAGSEFDLADDGLAIGHQRQRPVEALDRGAGDIDPVELPLERTGIGWKFYGNEGAADARARSGGFELRHVEAEIGEHAAHPADARFHAVLDRGQCRHLAPLDGIERGLQADQNVVDALNLGKLIWLRLDDHGRARFQPRFAIRRCHEDHGIADRGGF